MSEEKLVKTNPEHHYFASCALCWAVSDTRQGAIDKVAREVGSEMLARMKKQGGLYCWTVRVDEPIEQHYDIEMYRPVGVALAESSEVYIQTVRGAVRLDNTTGART